MLRSGGIYLRLRPPPASRRATRTGMKVALFGGTFDPPHCAHRQIADAAHREFGFDQVWWIPAVWPPHKAGLAVTGFTHRLAMVRLEVRGCPAFRVKDLESNRLGPSYSVDTVEAAVRAHPEHQFSLLLGGDSLEQFHRWHAPERIVAQVPLVVCRRRGVKVAGPLPSFLKGRIRYCSIAPAPVAGTAVRALVARAGDAGGVVSEAVQAYIAAHGLYRNAA